MIQEDSIDKLRSLKDFLGVRIKGQPIAIDKVCEALLRAEMGLSKANKPRSSFLFLGPTGVGKTEMALAISDFLYGSSDRFARFDMAEFQKLESIGLLLGENRNEQGRLGDEIDRLNSKGGGVLLFDEIEKANVYLSTIFLSILDAARITMSNGSTKSLSNFYLIFTSNLGGASAAKMKTAIPETVEKHILMEAEHYFKPELYVRFSKKIVFYKLDSDAQMEIAKNLIDAEIKHIKKKLGLYLIVEDTVFYYLVDRGYSPFLGVRPMLGVIEDELGKAVSEWILSRNCNNNTSLHLKVKNDKLVIIEEKNENEGRIQFLEKCA